MASILDKYGIKEVADVTFYEINNDGSMGAPVLYLDTLKVSTVEQTAETVDAKGGKGNPPLITWDYGKEINVTLEDALFSAKSMAIMFSGNANVTATPTTLKKTLEFVGSTAPTQWTDNNGIAHAIATPSYYDASGTSVTAGDLASDQRYFVTFNVTTAGDAVTIEISPNAFPGTYYVTGDTYARSYATGKDEFFQFIIPKAKVLSEQTLTLEAEGDPTVFSMNLRVLRALDGEMMKLVKYSV